ncbi:MAG: TlpA family protein disulfide reductase [Sulfuricella denitrificans]|nr:TlpA family protein disulfide reductase [Sulfuricella denitrificans]
MRWFFYLVLLCLPAIPAHAVSPDPKPFGPGSMKEVAVAHAGKPFILAFWSLSCAHCKANLEQFGQLLRQHPGLSLELVSTDTPEEGAAIMATLEKYGLEKLQTRVFADRFVERLQFEIDRRWRGELPRTYFYDASHQARTITGRLDATETERWISANYPQTSE